MSETITLAHSPDSDDAFMFYGLATHKLDTRGLNFQHLLKDIQTLNEEAMRGTYDVTAISFHAYAYIHDKYRSEEHTSELQSRRDLVCRLLLEKKKKKDLLLYK